ncbi:MAG TPA: prepilin-type N-terminal cleavage/methylation domain-containing protein, partial [Pseudomonadales bacterium]|nr:prepilin-type N-terminal cleavage/methylation domain-containing protein [Pseudomonadales bacterium]
MNTNAYTHQRGYTLLELLTALTVLLILTTLALPSFSNIVRRTQSDTQVYALAKALGVPDAVCA